jgi:hypothetical protein
MRRIAAVLVATAILMAMALSASAAIHPIVCSGNAVANGLVDNPARSDDIGNPPGLTPHDPDDLLGFGFPHFDALEAGDDNPTIKPPFGLSANQFAPLFHTDDTGPAWDKDCGPTP